MKLRDLKLLKVALILTLSACGKTPLETSDKSSTNAVEAPTNLEAETISENTIQISWKNPSLSEDYWIRIEYKKSSEANYTSTTIAPSSSFYTLGSLDSGTTYDVRLLTIVGNGDKSKYTDEASATTFRSIIFNPDALPLVAPSMPTLDFGNLPVMWSYLAANGSNVKYFEVRFHLLDINGDDFSTGTFQMVEYPSIDQKYKTTRLLAGTGCGTNDKAAQITFDVRATPNDSNINTYSAWAPVRGSIPCTNIQ